MSSILSPGPAAFSAASMLAKAPFRPAGSATNVFPVAAGGGAQMGKELCALAAHTGAALPKQQA